MQPYIGLVVLVKSQLLEFQTWRLTTVSCLFHVQSTIYFRRGGNEHIYRPVEWVDKIWSRLYREKYLNTRVDRDFSEASKNYDISINVFKVWSLPSTFSLFLRFITGIFHFYFATGYRIYFYEVQGSLQCTRQSTEEKKCVDQERLCISFIVRNTKKGRDSYC